VIDRCYPLANAEEAHAYVDKGHKQGSVVLSVSEKSGSGIDRRTNIAQESGDRSLFA